MSTLKRCTAVVAKQAGPACFTLRPIFADVTISNFVRLVPDISLQQHFPLFPSKK